MLIGWWAVIDFYDYQIDPYDLGKIHNDRKWSDKQLDLTKWVSQMNEFIITRVQLLENNEHRHAMPYLQKYKNRIIYSQSIDT